MLGTLFRKNKALNLSKEDWISKYGSKALKLRIKNGYHFESLYAKERCQKEFPKFGGLLSRDFLEVRCPSAKAMKLLEKTKNNPYFNQEKYTVRIILRNVKWISVIHGCAYERLSEAILIENYLDGYHIWQPIQPD